MCSLRIVYIIQQVEISKVRINSAHKLTKLNIIAAKTTYQYMSSGTKAYENIWPAVELLVNIQCTWKCIRNIYYGAIFNKARTVLIGPIAQG